MTSSLQQGDGSHAGDTGDSSDANPTGDRSDASKRRSIGTPPVTLDLSALSAWAPELARTFVSLASDIALVIDANGVICNVAQGGTEPIAAAAYAWVGRHWIDTVSGETRPKIETLLKEVAATGIAQRREVNHPLTPGISIPVAYTAIRLGENGPVLAVGRDLRVIAAIQQRYVESQQEMERGYWQARQAEARYQLLFQVATDAVIVVDANTLQILEANQAAARLFNTAAEQLHGCHASFGFEHYSRVAVNELLNAARSTGEATEIRARLQGTTTSASVVATPFRADDGMRLLVRVRAVEAGASASILSQTLSRLVDDANDSVVVTDSSGRIRVANAAFLALVNLTVEAEVEHQPLMGWLGLTGQPLTVLLAKVRRDGVARHFESWVRPAGKVAARIEISAALMTEGDQECIGFTIRRSALRGPQPVTRAAANAMPVAGVSQIPCGSALDQALRHGIEQVVAQLDAPDLAGALRETSALVEQQFVQLALQRTHGDEAAAALLLGISPARLARLRLQTPDAARAPLQAVPCVD